MSKVFQIFRKEKYFCMKGCMSKKIVEKKRAKKKNESQRRHSEINLHNMLLTFPHFSFSYCLWLFSCYKSWVTVTICPAKLKALASQSFSENICRPTLDDSFNCLGSPFPNPPLWKFALFHSPACWLHAGPWLYLDYVVPPYPWFCFFGVLVIHGWTWSENIKWAIPEIKDS